MMAAICQCCDSCIDAFAVHIFYTVIIVKHGVMSSCLSKQSSTLHERIDRSMHLLSEYLSCSTPGDRLLGALIHYVKCHCSAVTTWRCSLAVQFVE
jgi:hypothetical protein